VNENPSTTAAAGCHPPSQDLDPRRLAENGATVPGDLKS